MELDNHKEYFHCFTCTREHRKRYINRGGSLEVNTQPVSPDMDSPAALPPSETPASSDTPEPSSNPTDNPSPEEETTDGAPGVLETDIPAETPAAEPEVTIPEHDSEHGSVPAEADAAASAYGQHQVTCENAG